MRKLKRTTWNLCWVGYPTFIGAILPLILLEFVAVILTWDAMQRWCERAEDAVCRGAASLFESLETAVERDRERDQNRWAA
jgi:hypothetical protein